MKRPARWIPLLRTVIFRTGRTSTFRLPTRHFVVGCIALIVGGLLLAGSSARAGTVAPDDILVIDQGANELIQ